MGIIENIKRWKGERKGKELQRLREERVRTEGDARISNLRQSEQARINKAKAVINKERYEKIRVVQGMFGMSSSGPKRAKRVVRGRKRRIYRASHSMFMNDPFQ
jgi:hypothetical protein